MKDKTNGIQAFVITRKRLGWSRYKMARELRITQTQLAYIENQAQKIQIRILRRLASIWLAHSGKDISDFWALLDR